MKQRERLEQSYRQTDRERFWCGFVSQKNHSFFCLCDGDADHHHDQNYNHYLRTTAIINTTNTTFKNIVNMFTLLYKPILNNAQDFIFQINQIYFKIYIYYFM